MFLGRGLSSLSSCAPLPSVRPTIGRASTLVGSSGRVYTELGVLRLNPRTKEPQIFKAQCGDELFAFKRVSESFFTLSRELALAFPNTDRLRMHTDDNEEQRTLVYPYYRDILLGLIQRDAAFPPDERPKILRVDVKPDNILVNWEGNDERQKTVSKTVLGDFDLAYHFPLGKRERLDAPYPLGNVMWRSPEGQTGKGLTFASDVYSFGLVCVYTLGDGELLLLDNLDELAENNILPGQEILMRHFCYFGLATPGLLEQVNDEGWCNALRGVSADADSAVRDNPGLRFTTWGQELGPAAIDLISGMTNADPSARLTMQQVLDHPYWDEE